MTNLVSLKPCQQSLMTTEKFQHDNSGSLCVGTLQTT